MSCLHRVPRLSAEQLNRKTFQLGLHVLVLCVLATAQDFPLKTVPMFTYVVDYEASWAPDGRQIVLISNRHGAMKVHVLQADTDQHGSEMKQLTTGTDEDDSPVWSPDGRQIAFVSIHDGVSDIFVMNADGSGVRQLTRDIGQNIHPAWFPDGSRILFNTTFFSQQIQSQNGTTGERRVIGEARDDSIDLASIRTDGSDLRPLTHGGGYTYAFVSPDGKYIVHRRQHGQTSQVFVMKSDGSDDTNLSGSETLDGWPSWSPDGKKIVFSRHTPSGFQIVVMNRDGSGLQQVTSAAGEFVNPRWSPDGSRILCGRRMGGVSMGLVLFPAPH